MGTNSCICKTTPEMAQRAVDQGVMPITMFLDHRCPKHGEQAQPAVWGRHKEMELVVTLSQWESLKKFEQHPDPFSCICGHCGFTHTRAK